jgi:hypothetical protein
VGGSTSLLIIAKKEKDMIVAAEQPTSLHEFAVCEFLAKRSDGAEADDALNNALDACLSKGIEVVSVRPEWVELRVPCDLAAISPLQELVTQLEAGLSPEVGEAISCAFREILCNALEYVRIMHWEVEVRSYAISPNCL